MYQYEVVPVTAGAEGGSDSGSQWATLRAGLNERGRLGFRVVAVTEGHEGRAIIMEREVEDEGATRGAAARYQSVSEAAEDITRESAGRSSSGQPRPEGGSPGTGR
jgi:hypothetical protein